MARVARRDTRALEILYDRYAGIALATALKLVGDRTLGEEIVQEAFWRVWNRAKTYKNTEGNFGAWFSGIVRHLAIDELRRQRARPPIYANEMMGTDTKDWFDARVDVFNTVHSRLVADQICAAIRKLPPTQQRVIELAYLQGLTHQEISDTLGEPLGTVHTRVRIGLLNMRKMLNPQMAI